MKYYYYSDNNQQFGPFTLDEFKHMRLKKSTLVWTDGLQSWTTADKLEELKDFLISEPPPLPNGKTSDPDNTVKISLKSPSISKDYVKESEATVVGVLVLILPITLKLLGVLNFEIKESYNQGTVFLAIASLAIRIFVTSWVVGIANRQNRNSNGWGWFAFFFPSISLIVIGLLNKLPLKINMDSSLSTDEQIAILKTKVDEFKGDLRWEEALSVLAKIKDLKIDYPGIEEEIKNCKSKFHPNKNDEAKSKIFLYGYPTSKGKLEIEQNQKSYPDINFGKMALLNGLQAPTGKYKLGFMWYVHIKDGIVEKVSTF